MVATPQAQLYSGSRKAPLLERLRGRLAERHQKIIGQRIEILPTGATWGSHLTWRGTHAGEMHYYNRLDLPEPDAPVLYREYSRFDRTLYVIGTPLGPSDDQIVVLTALVKPA